MSNKNYVFNDPRICRIFASQLYVAKNMDKNPSVAIKFILDNKDYFPTVSEIIINQIIKEKNLDLDTIKNLPLIKIADIQL